jgi:hypothetical protein
MSSICTANPCVAGTTIFFFSLFLITSFPIYGQMDSRRFQCTIKCKFCRNTVSFDTCYQDVFVAISLSELGCPPKLVLYRNNRNWNRNQFWHYPKQDVCFGCFALISKQGISVFRNNQKKTKDQPKQQQIC